MTKDEVVEEILDVLKTVSEPVSEHLWYVNPNTVRRFLERAWEAGAKDKATTLINTAVEELEKAKKTGDYPPVVKELGEIGDRVYNSGVSTAQNIIRGLLTK